MLKKIIATLILFPLAALALDLSPCTAGSALQYTSINGFGCGVPTLSMSNVGIADANYTALATDQVITYTSLTASRTVTLTPAGTPTNLKLWQVKDVSGNASIAKPINLASTSGTFDGLVTTAITEAFGSKIFYDDGTKFFMGGAFLPAVGSNTIQKSDGNGGLVSATAGVDYAAPSSATRIFQYPGITSGVPSRTLNTCFQVSATQDADVNYNANVNILLSLGGGTAVITSYTNSGCTTGVQSLLNGAVSNVAVGGTASIPLHAIVPAGKWIKITSTISGGIGSGAALDSIQSETLLP